jgi:hypothetical protein
VQEFVGEGPKYHCTPYREHVSVLQKKKEKAPGPARYKPLLKQTRERHSSIS